MYSVETRKWEGTLDTLHSGNATSATVDVHTSECIV